MAWVTAEVKGFQMYSPDVQRPKGTFVASMWVKLQSTSRAALLEAVGKIEGYVAGQNYVEEERCQG